MPDRIKSLFTIFAIVFVLSFLFGNNYKFYTQKALVGTADSMVGPISKDPIKDILEVSRAYGALFGVDSCSLAKSMTGVFYVETNGKQNSLNYSTKDKYKYIGSFQQGVPFVVTSLRFLGSDLQRMYKLARQGKINKTTLDYMTAAIRQGKALGLSRGRLHHMYSTIIALVQHARMEKALQKITQNQLERGAAHVIFQFAPPTVGYAIRSGRLDKVFNAKGNCGIGRTTIRNAIRYIASGRSKCYSRMVKGMNLQNCSTKSGYDGVSGIGGIDNIPKVPIPTYTPDDPRDYIPPVDIPDSDPFYGYKEAIDELYDSNSELPDNPFGANENEQDDDNIKDNEDSKSLLDKFDEYIKRGLFGNDMQGTLNEDLINENANLQNTNDQLLNNYFKNNNDDENGIVNKVNNVENDLVKVDTGSNKNEESAYNLPNTNKNDIQAVKTIKSDSEKNDEFLFSYDFENGDDDEQYASFYDGKEVNQTQYLSSKVNSFGGNLLLRAQTSRKERTHNDYEKEFINQETEAQKDTMQKTQNDTKITHEDIIKEKQKIKDFIQDPRYSIDTQRNDGKIAYYFNVEDLKVKAEDMDAFMKYIDELKKQEKGKFNNGSEDSYYTKYYQTNKPQKNYSFWEWLLYIFSFKWIID